MKRNITLIGMPSAGKSTVGVLLAKRLGYSFLDVDIVIQEKTGKLLKEIIAEKRSKKGPRPVDLKPMILKADACASGDTLLLQLTMTAGISVNLNPTLVTDTFGGWAGFEPDYHSIRRDAVRCGDGAEFR